MQEILNVEESLAWKKPFVTRVHIALSRTLSNVDTRCTRGPFLESPENFSGPNDHS